MTLAILEACDRIKTEGYEKQILECKDIDICAKRLNK